MSSTTPKSKRSHSNDDLKRSPAKRKVRNESEKRRRDLFSQLIVNLEDILYIDKKSPSNEQTNKTSSAANRLDKASILRETASYLKKHRNDLILETSATSSSSVTTDDKTIEIPGFSWKPELNLLSTEEWLQTAIESMHSFFLVVKFDPYNGQIVYVSKNINSLLDYSQDEILNRSLFELISPRDHDQLRDYLLKDHKVLEKCNVSWRRATAEDYEQCTIIGAFRENQINKDEKYLMSIVTVNTSDRTLIINNDNSIREFTTRLNPHGRFTHIDSKAREFLGYTSYELIGHTFFDFVHPDDLPIIVRAHKLWKENGSGQSDPYRFLTKGQQWIFLQTSCRVQINSWTGKPESYICTTNPLQNATESLQKQLSAASALSQMDASVQSPSSSNAICTSSPQRRNSSTDTQITSFLTNLASETYRTNIREKLNEHRTRKQAEIRIREEEIKVIEDVIQFVDDFQSKHSLHLTHPTNSTLSLPATTAIIDETKKTNREDLLSRIPGLGTDDDPTILSSPLSGAIEDLSPSPFPLMSRHMLSRYNQDISSSKDDPIIDSLTYPLFSPQAGPFSIPSPPTPFSIPSRPSPLSVSPAPPSPFPHSLSPFNNNPTPRDTNNPTASSSSSSLSPSSSTETITTTNANLNQTEQSTKKSSFNRSLPHSLVS